jgi:hypothetical protein
MLDKVTSNYDKLTKNLLKMENENNNTKWDLTPEEEEQFKRMSDQLAENAPELKAKKEKQNQDFNWHSIVGYVCTNLTYGNVRKA